MPGTFTVTVSTGQFGMGSVSVTLNSYNNFQGTVTMTYSTDPGAPTAVPDRTTDSIYVPKNGESTPVTRTIQMNGVNSCHFYADGVAGSLSASDDCEVAAAPPPVAPRPMINQGAP
jgi:hypothetical protein